MTFIEAIKKAYEKACNLKKTCGLERKNGNYIYYSTLSRDEFTRIDVEDSGKVCLDFIKDLNVDDLAADDWEI